MSWAAMKEKSGSKTEGNAFKTDERQESSGAASQHCKILGQYLLPSAPFVPASGW